MPKPKEQVDTYICVMKLKGHKTWRIVLVNRDLDKIKKHLENEMHAEVEDSKTFKLSGVEGTVGRYFLT